MKKFSHPLPLDEAIAALRLPDDVRDWFRQTAFLDPDFPRRLIDGQLCVIPDQAAEFLVNRSQGHLLSDGPFSSWRFEDDDGDPDDEEGDDDEGELGDESDEKEEAGDERDDDRRDLRRRSALRPRPPLPPRRRRE